MTVVYLTAPISWRLVQISMRYLFIWLSILKINILRRSWFWCISSMLLQGGHITTRQQMWPCLHISSQNLERPPPKNCAEAALAASLSLVVLTTSPYTCLDCSIFVNAAMHAFLWISILSFVMTSPDTGCTWDICCWGFEIMQGWAILSGCERATSLLAVKVHLACTIEPKQLQESCYCAILSTFCLFWFWFFRWGGGAHLW